MGQLRITLRRSLIGSTSVQRACVATLGLRRVGQAVARPDDPRTAGLLRKVGHLVEAVPLASEPAGDRPRETEGEPQIDPAVERQTAVGSARTRSENPMATARTAPKARSQRAKA